MDLHGSALYRKMLNPVKEKYCGTLDLMHFPFVFTQISSCFSKTFKKDLIFIISMWFSP